MDEPKLFATFERRGEFIELQTSFLALDVTKEPSQAEERAEAAILDKLSNILDEYQEQSYLLDSLLESLVVPVVETLKSHAKLACAGPTSIARISRVGSLLYFYVKFRGQKTISSFQKNRNMRLKSTARFFPHEIADLTIAIDYMQLQDGPTSVASQWQLRYVVLLWLSLVCMIPFNLAQFDDSGQVALDIESLAKQFMSKAGLEREGAAILLSRLYMRQDAVDRFHAFLEWSMNETESNPEIFKTVAILHVLCEVVKSGPEAEIVPKAGNLLEISNSIGKHSNWYGGLAGIKLITTYFSSKKKSDVDVYRLYAEALAGLGYLIHCVTTLGVPIGFEFSVYKSEDPELLAWLWLAVMLGFFFVLPLTAPLISIFVQGIQCPCLCARQRPRRVKVLDLEECSYESFDEEEDKTTIAPHNL